VVLSRSFLSDQENATTAANEDGNVGGEYPEDVIKAGSLEDALEKLKAGEFEGENGEGRETGRRG
jgi:hypothetical protein